MSCNESSNISFEFQTDDGTTYLEIRPREIQFERSRGKFDLCTAEFSQEVVDHIQPHVENDNSVFRQPLPVILKIEDTPVHRLLWVPESPRFTGDEVHIEFHDAQKILTRGEVDWKRDTVKLREAYEHVFDQRDKTGPTILKGIKFTDTDQEYEELVARYRGDEGFWKGVFRQNSKEYKDTAQEERIKLNEDGNIRSQDEAIRSLEEKNISNIIEGHSAINFDRVTPWKAINELNEKFGATTWVGPDGYLWVGSRVTSGFVHFATPDDSRVWKLSDYNVTPPRDPVIQSRVRGGWADDPTESHVENIFWEIESLNHGTEEFRIEGVATLDGAVYGQEIVTELEAKRDALEDIAKRKMINKQRQQWEGYIEIDPELSGREITDPKHVEVGDRINTIPPDSDSGEDGGFCDSNIKNSLFDVVGITHSLSPAGNWNLRLDIVPVLQGDLSPDNIETRLRYYDPAAKEFLEKDDLDTDTEFWPDYWYEPEEIQRIEDVDTDEEFDLLI